MSRALEKTLKELSDAIAKGAAFQRGTQVLPFDLDRDYESAEALVLQEEWPFVRTDFELSHAQPGGCSMVAYRENKLAGFFSAHAFGKIGYLDMMIIAPEFRRKGVARPLYISTMHGLANNGMQSYVVHTTNDSARIISLLGFAKTTTDFTLLVRDPLNSPRGTMQECDPDELINIEENQLIDLDATIFGQRRESWIRFLRAQPQTKFAGIKESDDALSAALWLRPRRNGAYCIDGCVYRKLEDLGALVQQVVEKFSDRSLECFVTTNSYLHETLVAAGFEQPEFFRAIGPLVEWHKGNIEGMAPRDKVQCLMWL